MHWSKSVFMLRRLVFLTILLALSVFTTSHHPTQAAASFPPGFVSEVVIGSGLFLPTAIAFASDNRIFIAEKRGVVRVWQNGTLYATPFIDLQDEVSDHGDRGLLGLALHPNFPTTPYVYLLYTYDPPGVVRDANGSRVSRLLRVTASATNPNVAATGPGSRVVLLGTNSTLANSGNTSTLDDQENPSCGRGPDYVRDCVPADFDTHDIGTVAFGKDGMLYVGNGDAASFLYPDKRSLRALELDSMAGKIFRIDPLTGAGLSDNPFYNGDPDANRSKVLSLGLRNPFRFTLHPVTNELYVGDVGMDTWEEINAGRGKNFGWPCYEGNAQQGLYANSPLTAERCRQLYAEGADAVQMPAYAYQHAGTGAATSGGVFYTGANYPAQYRGVMFIADYNRDWIKYLTFDAQGRATVRDFAEAVGGEGGPAQLLVGPDGNLYYVVLGAVNEVRRIRYVNVPNQPPVAHLNATPSTT
jgi:glucose/arabinose dehydrogenase